MQGDEKLQSEMSNRLAKLEAQNRRTRIVSAIAGAAAFVCMVASLSFALGQARLSFQHSAQSRPVAALSVDTVVARRFTLTDGDGRTLAELATTEGDVEMPILRFYGLEPFAKRGTVLRMTMGVVPDPEIVVYHPFGPLKSGNDQLMSLSFPTNEPIFILRSGRANLSGVNPGGFMLDFSEDGVPSLVLTDRKGYMTTVGGVPLTDRRTGETRTTSAASLALSNKAGKVLWAAP